MYEYKNSITNYEVALINYQNIVQNYPQNIIQKVALTVLKKKFETLLENIHVHSSK